ncbi:Uncharacterised protein [uncultured archaeon]|nr:Uncharacterised protein [uncultured archaeon]
MNLTYRCKHIDLGNGSRSKEPIIPVTLIGEQGTKFNFTAILDSGSDFVLLPLEVAEALELELDKSAAEKAKSFTGTPITTTMSNVRTRIQKGHEAIEIKCRCAVLLDRQSQHEHIIFGSSFFDHFKITFDYQNNRFQIKN